MTLYVIRRAHVDKDGNHRRVGDPPLELSEEQARPFLKRGEIAAPEDAARIDAAQARRSKTVTYAFHPYER